jgi:hypothetical protein
MIFWIVVARPEDVIHLEHDEPELGVGEEVRGRHASQVVARVATSTPRTSSLTGEVAPPESAT